MKSSPEIERIKLRMYRGCDFAKLYYELPFSLEWIVFSGVLYSADTTFTETFSFEINDTNDKLLVIMDKTKTANLTLDNYLFDWTYTLPSGQKLPFLLGDVEIQGMRS